MVPSAYSEGLSGIAKGMRELHTLGLVKTMPRMVAAEPFGPLAHALERGLEAPESVEGGDSVAFSIASRYGTYQGLAALRASRGIGVRITDEGVFEAQRALAREEGIFAEPSSAAALTAVLQLRDREAIAPDEVVVVVLRSCGLMYRAEGRTASHAEGPTPLAAATDVRLARHLAPTARRPRSPTRGTLRRLYRFGHSCVCPGRALF